LDYLGSITLRNKRKIYKTSAGFKVVTIDRHSEEYHRVFKKSDISFLREILKNKSVTVKEAVELVSDYIESGEIDIKYEYGHKLQYYIQDMILILVVIYKYNYRKNGNEYTYSIE
jgi:hypothetical protein